MLVEQVCNVCFNVGMRSYSGTYIGSGKGIEAPSAMLGFVGAEADGLPL
jgi:hypothetical protein